MMELISAHNERHIGEMIMDRKILAVVLSFLVLFTASCNNVNKTDLESDEPTGRERSITESVSESTYETRYCEICGSSCEYGDENWDYISRYGMCRSCYTFQSEAQEEMDDSEERWAEENGYIEADYNPADYNVFAFFVNDHTVQFVNHGDEPWQFDESCTLLIRLGRKFWYVDPVEDAQFNDTVHVLAPDSSIYIDCDLSIYGDLTGGYYNLVYGDIGDGAIGYSAIFSVHYGEISITGYGGYPSIPALDRLLVIYGEFRELQESDDYIRADNDYRIDMTQRLIDELATDGYYTDNPGYPLVRDYPFPIIDIESVELVDNEEETVFYFDTIDGYPAVFEISSC